MKSIISSSGSVCRHAGEQLQPRYPFNTSMKLELDKILSNNSPTVLQQDIARMLFWGQQGVSTNIEKAVRHYERGAVQLEDPVSMYDYGIVLLQVSVKFDVKWATWEFTSSICVINYSTTKKLISFFVGTRCWKGHSKSCHFPEEGNGPGNHSFITNLPLKQ